MVYLPFTHIRLIFHEKFNFELRQSVTRMRTILRIRMGLAPWIRIRIELKAGSGSALKLVWMSTSLSATRVEGPLYVWIR